MTKGIFVSNVHLNKSCAQVDGFEKMFPNKDGILALEKISTITQFFFFFFLLVTHVGERPWWPIQCLSKGRKKRANG